MVTTYRNMSQIRLCDNMVSKPTAEKESIETALYCVDDAYSWKLPECYRLMECP